MSNARFMIARQSLAQSMIVGQQHHVMIEEILRNHAENRNIMHRRRNRKRNILAHQLCKGLLRVHQIHAVERDDDVIRFVHSANRLPGISGLLEGSRKIVDLRGDVEA